MVKTSPPTVFIKTTSRIARLILVVGSLIIVALTLYAYRELPARPFAADDYQWLLHVRGLSLAELLVQAFDPGSQRHFFRPLVWLLFWVQTRLFGLESPGFHAVSLVLHLLNAGLAGLLAQKLIQTSSPWVFVFAMAFVALHPAPFEAVVWISAQSELLGAALLLGALLVWVKNKEQRTENKEQRTKEQENKRTREQENKILRVLRGSRSPGHLVTWSHGHAWAVLLLGLAMLAKESAVLGLPLMIVLDHMGEKQVFGQQNWRSAHFWRRYLGPALLTMAYLLLQVWVGSQNRVLREGLYGIGPQLLLNPLRSLALLLAPLAHTEHADATWLVPFGGVVALILLGLLWLGWQKYKPLVGIIVVLHLTLLPAAPFFSPPDSRYLYLPVIAMALVLGVCFSWLKQHTPGAVQRLQAGFWLALLGCTLLSGAALSELSAREWRFAAASGPGGSLWHLTGKICTDVHPARVVVVDPPLLTPHVEAIVQLACPAGVRPVVTTREQLEQVAKPDSVVIAFPGGSAAVESWR